ncbi:MAG: DUF362 domain-containing protein [Thermodesulfobacteriota bacterium]
MIGEILDKAVLHYLPQQWFHGRTILLKPNLVSLHASSLAITEPDFILAAARWFTDQGCKVSIGDSPAFGSCRSILRRHGVEQKLQDMGVTIADFSDAVQVRLSQGTQLSISRQVLESELVVNMPRVKAHGQMYVTLGVKNLFGIVNGIRKAGLHFSHGESTSRFAELILALHEQVPQLLNICDGVVAMNGTGPISGRPLELGCLAVSDNAVALDSALLSVLELPHHRSPLWIAAQSGAMDGWEVEKINYVCLHPGYFHPSGFTAPDRLVPIRFSIVHVVRSLIKRGLHFFRQTPKK